MQVKKLLLETCSCWCCRFHLPVCVSLLPHPAVKPDVRFEPHRVASSRSEGPTCNPNRSNSRICTSDSDSAWWLVTCTYYGVSDSPRLQFFSADGNFFETANCKRDCGEKLKENLQKKLLIFNVNAKISNRGKPPGP